MFVRALPPLRLRSSSDRLAELPAVARGDTASFLPAKYDMLQVGRSVGGWVGRWVSDGRLVRLAWPSMGGKGRGRGRG